MKALLHLAVGKKALEQRPKPEIAAPMGGIIKITGTTICGTDLHIAQKRPAKLQVFSAMRALASKRTTPSGVPRRRKPSQ